LGAMSSAASLVLVLEMEEGKAAESRATDGRFNYLSSSSVFFSYWIMTSGPRERKGEGEEEKVLCWILLVSAENPFLS